MKAATNLNYLALNQNILCKPLRFGMGPEDGIETVPHITKTGFKVYLNGIHTNPGHSHIEDHLLIGYMKHPHAMDGMPGCSGELEYYLCITENEFIAIVSLKPTKKTMAHQKLQRIGSQSLNVKNFPRRLKIAKTTTTKSPRHYSKTI